MGELKLATSIIDKLTDKEIGVINNLIKFKEAQSKLEGFNKLKKELVLTGYGYIISINELKVIEEELQTERE